MSLFHPSFPADFARLFHTIVEPALRHAYNRIQALNKERHLAPDRTNRTTEALQITGTGRFEAKGLGAAKSGFLAVFQPDPLERAL